MAATRLAVREARSRTEPSAPLHLVGFSNGGALALIYALDSLSDEKLARPDRLVLISPMVGITRAARYAGLAGLPAILPAFAKAAWLGIVPEFNPFKYNSFPVNGARQSYRLTRDLQERIARYSREGKLGQLPPILTFQSLIDFTVSTGPLYRRFMRSFPRTATSWCCSMLIARPSSALCSAPAPTLHWRVSYRAVRDVIASQSLPTPMTIVTM